jgi:hypothetical protein
LGELTRCPPAPAYQCAAVGLHCVAAKLFAALPSAAETDVMYWWLRGLSLASAAEVQLGERGVGDGAVRAARTLQQAGDCFHAAAAPLAFQQVRRLLTWSRLGSHGSRFVRARRE